MKGLEGHCNLHKWDLRMSDMCPKSSTHISYTVGEQSYTVGEQWARMIETFFSMICMTFSTSQATNPSSHTVARPGVQRGHEGHGKCLSWEQPASCHFRIYQTSGKMLPIWTFGLARYSWQDTFMCFLKSPYFLGFVSKWERIAWHGAVVGQHMLAPSCALIHVEKALASGRRGEVFRLLTQSYIVSMRMIA